MKKALLLLGVAGTLLGSVAAHSSLALPYKDTIDGRAPGVDADAEERTRHAQEAGAVQTRGVIAFFSDRAGVGDLYLVDPATAKTRRITRGGAVSGGTFSSLSVLYNEPPVWAPDARALLFVNADGDRPVLNVVGADGTGLRQLATNALCASWSPDGRLIAFTRSRASSGDVWLMRADGTRARRLVRDGVCPRWSRDGRMIAFTSRAGGEIISPTGARRRRLVRRGFVAGWSPDGASILFTRTRDDVLDLYVVEVHSGNERLLVRNGAMPAWSPSGDYVVFQGARSLGPPPSSDAPDIAVTRPDGKEQRWLTRDSASDDFPTWSPDGLQVAFSNDLTFTREWRSGDEIFVVGVDGSGRRRLTRNKAHDILPSWSPAP